MAAGSQGKNKYSVGTPSQPHCAAEPLLTARLCVGGGGGGAPRCVCPGRSGANGACMSPPLLAVDPARVCCLLSWASSCGAAWRAPPSPLPPDRGEGIGLYKRVT